MPPGGRLAEPGSSRGLAAVSNSAKWLSYQDAETIGPVYAALVQDVGFAPDCPA
jgi:hypothetical protein